MMRDQMCGCGRLAVDEIEIIATGIDFPVVIDICGGCFDILAAAPPVELARYGLIAVPDVSVLGH